MPRLIMLLLPLLLAACVSIPPPQERKAHADALAAAKGWQASPIAAGRFDVVAYAPNSITPAETLTLYIEGDGFAWVSGSTPSADPTPRDPLALRLALGHPDGNAAYLARPCQYVDAAQSGCSQHYWTEGRFSEDVISATDMAVTVLKQRFAANQLVLLGYSGGGAVAALLAARRNDVVRLVTIAGNLDHRAWTEHHRIRELDDSLNAIDSAERLTRLPQTHFVGADDRIMPPLLAQRWPQSFVGVDTVNLLVVPGFDHVCCWVERWPTLFFRTD